MPSGARLPGPADPYRYVLSNPNVDMVLTAPQTFEQLEENLKALEMGPVSAQEKEWLETIGDHVRALNPSTNFDFIFQAFGPARSSRPSAGP